MTINSDTLVRALSSALPAKITRAVYSAEQLKGGTVADVLLISGTAETDSGEFLPYKIVLKTQKKWERFADSESWRREYDLYESIPDSAFTDTFRRPRCYLAEMNNDETEIQLWMEYVGGVSGLDLTSAMCEYAAAEIGRFQGKLYARRPDYLQNQTNLSSTDYIKNYYKYYGEQEKVHDYIRSDGCALPMHIREMLIAADDGADDIFRRLEALPIVFCHRDFWVANIFCADDTATENAKITLIDWDTSGWGYLGEDLASLIADEADVGCMVENYRRTVAAYYGGFSEYADISAVTDDCVYEMILLTFGFRIVEWYIDASSRGDAGEMELNFNTLQKIYEMKH